MTYRTLRKTVACSFAGALALTAGAETLTLTGGTTTLSEELTMTGITFAGDTLSTIVAPIGKTADQKAMPTSEFSDIHGVAVLSPDGTHPGVIDASAFGSAGGKIETGLTDLVFDTTNQCVSGERTADGAPDKFLPVEENTNITGRAVTYWTNRQLKDIKSVRAIISYGENHNENVARTCFFANNGTTATMQFQSRMSYECDDTERRKNVVCVKVTLMQDGADITAQATYARHVTNSSSNKGECFDMDSVKSENTIYDGVKTKSGYGIRALMAGEAGTNGGKGITIALPEPTRTYDGEIAASNKSEIVYWKNLKIDDIARMTAELKAASAWKVANGYFMDRVDEDTLQVTFQRYAGNHAETLAGKSISVGHDYVVATVIEFKQDGDDVTAKFVKAGYRFMHSESNEDGKWWAAGALPMTPELVNWKNNSYNIRNIHLYTKPKVELRGLVDVAGGVKLTGGGTLKVSSPVSGSTAISGNGSVWYVSDPTTRPPMTNTLYVTDKVGTYDGYTVLDGGYHTAKKKGAFPANSTIVLTNDATLIVNVGATFCSGGIFHVYPGCTLRHDNRSNEFDQTNEIFLFGGTFTANHQQHYMGPLTLSDGALVNGDASFRFGYRPQFPHIYSIGTRTNVTNRIECGISLYRSNKTAATNRAEFVTFQTAADLVLAGKVFKSSDGGYEAALVKKRGRARLILAPTCENPADDTANTVRVEVVEGTLRNESAKALRDVNSVELHSGAAYEAVGKAQSIGALIVDAKSADGWEQADVATVRFENGGTLALPEGGLEIAEGTKLVLDGELTETSFRVGTTACLDKALLRRIKVQKGDKLRSVQQNEEGYIEEVIGMLMIVK